MKRIVVWKELCSGCRACEVACVAAHDGAFGTATARIRVSKDEARGLDWANVCRLCDEPECVAACPSGALTKDGAIGAVLLEAEACLQCLACMDACPFEMVFEHPQTGLPLICDLCGGDPSCVKRCATGAIVYGEENL